MRIAPGALALVFALAGCDLFGGEERLEGERIRIRPDRAEREAQEEGTSFGAAGVAGVATALPAPRPIDAWTQTNAVPSHNAGHLAGPASPERAWAVDAGEGSSAEGAITSAPVVAGGLAFALDAAAEVRAFDAGSGAERWRRSHAPEREGGEEGFGGGLAWARGRLFATTGVGEALALDPGSGEILWRVRLGAPVRAAPAVEGGVLVAVARDNSAYGLDTGSGAILWRARAASSGAGFLGGASPAIAGGGALVPFGSGEIVALDLATGRRFWSAILSGGRRGLARAAISDVTGDPVVVGPLVIAANQAGRIVAVVGSSGQRAWTRSIGAVGPIWAAGRSLFLVTDTARLMRLDASSGTTEWAVDLPAFEDMEDREGRILYSGPVLVEGRVYVTSSQGELLAFEGVDGGAVSTTELTGGSRTGPVVADGTLFVLTDDGTLEAYR
ncbi:MAG: PQQ-binding-like beta-propeller repeat protein [Paracoccaceae bacterium]